mmetsp:Transcript_9262/g.22758  ORF Transcript_9262/g.22758 Transcript_9262/m.22758 type:complete len:211 (+) Transcript_9262:2296-2928(+)
MQMGEPARCHRVLAFAVPQRALSLFVVVREETFREFRVLVRLSERRTSARLHRPRALPGREHGQPLRLRPPRGPREFQVVEGAANLPASRPSLDRRRRYPLAREDLARGAGPLGGTRGRTRRGGRSSSWSLLGCHRSCGPSSSCDCGGSRSSTRWNISSSRFILLLRLRLRRRLGEGNRRSSRARASLKIFTRRACTFPPPAGRGFRTDV